MSQCRPVLEVGCVYVPAMNDVGNRFITRSMSVGGPSCRSTHRAAPSDRLGHRSTLRTREPLKTIAFALSRVFLLSHVSLAPVPL